MLSNLERIRLTVGKTPLVQLPHDRINLFAKLEAQNFTGSLKVRPAFYILREAILRGDITPNTTVVESSSGNFALALASLCKALGIKFIPVIDPNITPVYEAVLRATAHHVVKVTERDVTGGFLLTRIKKVNELMETIPDAFWTNQYGNRDSFLAHYHGLGSELAVSFEQLDYAFIGVSSGGTISGVSRKLKETFPDIRIVAVDSVGSVIFGNPPKKRYIPGIGSSMRPDILREAIIDDVFLVPETEAITGCLSLFNEHGIFAGGSSGSSYSAINEYFKNKALPGKPNVVFLCPDGGTPYVDTVYNPEWVAKTVRETHVPINQ